METLPEDNSITGFDFEEADDALEPLHVGDDVEVVQQFVVVKVFNLCQKNRYLIIIEILQSCLLELDLHSSFSNLNCHNH